MHVQFTGVAGQEANHLVRAVERASGGVEQDIDPAYLPVRIPEGVQAVLHDLVFGATAGADEWRELSRYDQARVLIADFLRELAARHDDGVPVLLRELLRDVAESHEAHPVRDTCESAGLRAVAVIRWITHLIPPAWFTYCLMTLASAAITVAPSIRPHRTSRPAITWLVV